MTPGVRQGYDDVRRRMREACSRARRDPSAVRLVAITKTFPVATIRELLACGHSLLGENRIQEALPKIEAIGAAAGWHFVGHLQTNKVRLAVGRFELIHSLDSERLGREIARHAARAGARQAVLVQVHLGGEESKFGVAEDGLSPLLEALAGERALDVRGLMSVPPPAARPEDNRRWFVRLRELRERSAARSGLALDELSMGMTDDFEVAIEEGATLVRVGRAIFGERAPASEVSEVE